VVVDDRLIRIEVGYGLEGALTDLESSLIIKNKIAPFFKEGKYYEGLSNGIEAISEAILDDEEVVNYANLLDNNSNKVNPFNFLFYFFLLFLLIQTNISFFIRYFGKTKSFFAGGL
jgi:uncharacterized protein